MTQFIVAIFDKVTGAYHQPFFCVNAFDAIRKFAAVVQDNSTTLSKFPNDYDLYQLGTYDPQTGLLTQTPDQPGRLATGLDALRYENSFLGGDFQQMAKDAAEEEKQARETLKTEDE